MPTNGHASGFTRLSLPEFRGNGVDFRFRHPDKAAAFGGKGSRCSVFDKGHVSPGGNLEQHGAVARKGFRVPRSKKICPGFSVPPGRNIGTVQIALKRDLDNTLGFI